MSGKLMAVWRLWRQDYGGHHLKHSQISRETKLETRAETVWIAVSDIVISSRA